jgi:arabinose-5-phosphate isomerase
MSDALAMAFLKARNFSIEEFARLHPGGSLGRKLMRVEEIMRVGSRHCVLPETVSVRSVLQSISQTEGRPGAATLVDTEGNLRGIFTDGNLRRLLATKDAFLDEPVMQHMGQNPRCVRHDALVAEAIRILGEAKVDQLIVIDDRERPVGMIDIQDIIEVRGV